MWSTGDDCKQSSEEAGQICQRARGCLHQDDEGKDYNYRSAFPPCLLYWALSEGLMQRWVGYPRIVRIELLQYIFTEVKIYYLVFLLE